MNLHDRNRPTFERLPDDAEFLWVRLFATVLFGVAMFVIGYMSAEFRMKKDPPPCVVKPAPAPSAPKTKVQMKRWVESYQRQGAGVIK